MDVVYILGTGSLVGDEEIRYSVRSLQKHMLDLRDIYVVGENPDTLLNIKHIPANDNTKDKWKNAYIKTIRACKVEDLSDNFLLMNDDFFMLEDFMGQDWPFYALKDSNGGPCGIHSFHMHCPIVFNKEMYIKMPFDLNSKACRSPRTFFANFYKAPPKFSSDFILRVGEGCRDFDIQIKNRPCFSISDSAMLNIDFRDWLDSLYPETSTFE